MSQPTYIITTLHDDLDNEEDYDDYDDYYDDDFIYEEDEIEDEEDSEEVVVEEEVVEEEKNDGDVEDLVSYIKETLKKFEVKGDPCANCPQRPSRFARFIGDDHPCQHCEHNLFQVVYVDCGDLKL